MKKATIKFPFILDRSQMNCVNDSHMIVSGLPPAEHDQHCVQVETQKDKKTKRQKNKKTKRQKDKKAKRQI